MFIVEIPRNSGGIPIQREIDMYIWMDGWLPETSEHEPFEYDIIKTFKMVPLCGGCATARGSFEQGNCCGAAQTRLS